MGHIGSSDNMVYIGYLIVDLKRHAAGLGDLTEEESQAIGSILNRVGKHVYGQSWNNRGVI
ncbi:MAG: hypothetical protein WDZ91_11815 [Paenibacillaceae bacterium]